MKQATAKWNRKIPVIFPYYTKVEHRRHEVSRSGEVATPNLRGALRGDIPPKNILVRVKKINAWRLNITFAINRSARRSRAFGWRKLGGGDLPEWGPLIFGTG